MTTARQLRNPALHARYKRGENKYLHICKCPKCAMGRQMYNRMLWWKQDTGRMTYLLCPRHEHLRYDDESGGTYTKREDEEQRKA